MKNINTVFFVLSLLFVSQSFAQTIWLDDLDLSTMETGWGNVHARKSVDGNPLTVGGQKFERGVGTHAENPNPNLQVGENEPGIHPGFSHDNGVTCPT